jgi:hypothetical protein
MKYISRLEYNKENAWWVRVGPRIKGRYFHKHFSDLRYGSKNRSLQAAIEFRDASLTKLESFKWYGKKPKGHHKKPTIKSTTGIVGVFLRRKRGYNIWAATFYPVKYKSKTQCFSTHKYGHRKALEMAKAFRAEGLKTVAKARR